MYIHVCTDIFVHPYTPRMRNGTPRMRLNPYTYVHIYMEHTYMRNGPIYLYTHTHTCIYRNICAPLYTTHMQWSHISIYICTWNIRVCAMVPYMYIHIYIHECTDICVHPYTPFMCHGPIYLCTYVHQPYVYVQWSHISIHTYTYMYVQTCAPLYTTHVQWSHISIHMYMEHTYKRNGPIYLYTYVHG